MAPAHVRSLWDTARSAVGSITQLAASRLRPAFPLVPLPTAPAAHSLHTPCFQPAPARGALPKALPRPCIMHPHLPFASQTTLLLNRATAAWVHSQAAVMPLLCLRPRGTGTWRADAAESVASDQQRRWAATKRTSARASGGPAPQRTLLVHHRSQRASLLHEAVRLVETATGRRPEVLVFGSRKEGNLAQGAVLRKGALAALAERVDSSAITDVVLNLNTSGRWLVDAQDAIGGLPIVDRTGLVLRIFHQRAQTAEARLQVRLAELEYQTGRLVRRKDASGRMVMGLAGQEAEVVSSRGSAGQGTVGGAGETERNIQSFRLRVDKSKLVKELEAVRARRARMRNARSRSGIASIAVVGYTNAGKSSLMSALCHEDMGAEDKLFATLDTRTRSVDLAPGRKAVLVDTVGFIQQLPQQLVNAFRATLEESLQADVLVNDSQFQTAATPARYVQVHVIDASNPDAAQQRHAVHAVLHSLGMTPAHLRTHMVEVWNKCDRIPGLLPLEADGQSADACTWPFAFAGNAELGAAHDVLGVEQSAHTDRADVPLDQAAACTEAEQAEGTNGGACAPHSAAPVCTEAATASASVFEDAADAMSHEIADGASCSAHTLHEGVQGASTTEHNSGGASQREGEAAGAQQAQGGRDEEFEWEEGVMGAEALRACLQESYALWDTSHAPVLLVSAHRQFGLQTLRKAIDMMISKQQLKVSVVEEAAV